MIDERINREIAHLDEIKLGWSWYWETPAGKLRIQRRVDMITAHIHEGMDVLEVGCGSGFLTKEILKKNACFTITDIYPDYVQYAQENYFREDATYKVENAYDLTFPDGSFDLVVGSSVLHHLDTDKALNEFQRVLKHKGSIIFTEPNMLNPQIFAERKIPYIRKISKVSPDETAYVRWKISRSLEKAGFINSKIFPFDFLHPLVPEKFVPFFNDFSRFLEKVPGVKEIAGSLFVYAEKATD